MPLIEIKHRYTGEVIHAGEYTDLRAAVIQCVKNNVNLSGSNLSYSDLRGSNLSYSDLRGSDLRGSDLRGSNLSYSNLRGSNLSYSDLRGSDLSGSNLSGSNLSYSDLRGSDLSGSNLSGSNLRGSNLSYSNLSGSNLRGSNLSYSDLSGSNLRGSDLSGSNLRGSDLSGSNLSESKNLEHAAAQTQIVCDGDLRVWKKCQNEILVHLLIPADAKRSNATGRKCRAEYAVVLDVVGADVGVSIHNGKTEYRKGETVRCDKWDDNRWNECSGGIHFYLTRIEAENHV